ncbi:hypothetical protein Bbelb_410530 [Branchiostoma belcheri]|nr:hypothetical protein Bbelb_410530 [Branchiostoma belcheri]
MGFAQISSSEGNEQEVTDLKGMKGESPTSQEELSAHELREQGTRIRHPTVHPGRSWDDRRSQQTQRASGVTRVNWMSSASEDNILETLRCSHTDELQDSLQRTVAQRALDSQLKTVFREPWLSVLWTRSVLLQRLQDHFSEQMKTAFRELWLSVVLKHKTALHLHVESKDSERREHIAACTTCTEETLQLAFAAMCWKSSLPLVTITTVSLASPSEDSEGTTFDHLVTLGQRRANPPLSVTLRWNEPCNMDLDEQPGEQAGWNLTWSVTSFPVLNKPVATSAQKELY